MNLQHASLHPALICPDGPSRHKGVLSSGPVLAALAGQVQGSSRRLQTLSWSKMLRRWFLPVPTIRPIERGDPLPNQNGDLDLLGGEERTPVLRYQPRAEVQSCPTIS